MADDARQSLPDLALPDPEQAEALSAAFDFFELLRRLERRGGLFGHSGRPDREPARLGQHVRLAFSVQDVVEFLEPTDKAPARVTVANLGLLGGDAGPGILVDGETGGAPVGRATAVLEMGPLAAVLVRRFSG